MRYRSKYLVLQIICWMKWGRPTAAIVVDMRTWKLKPAYQKSTMKITKDIGRRFQDKNRYGSDNAADAMKEYGLKVNTPSKENLNEWYEVIDQIKNESFLSSLITIDAFDRLTEIKNNECE